MATAPTVTLQELPARRVAYLRHVGPYAGVDPTWTRLLAALAPGGWLRPETVALGIGHDNPAITPAAELRFDACLTVPVDFVPTPPVAVQMIPGGKYAVLRHRGSSTGLPAQYLWLLRDWLPASGRRRGPGPVVEVYVNRPDTTPEAELLTDIHLPLE